MRNKVKCAMMIAATSLVCMNPTVSSAFRIEAVQKGLDSLKDYTEAIDYLDCLENDIAPRDSMMYIYFSCRCNTACAKVLRDTDFLDRIMATKKDLELRKHSLTIGD